MPRSWLRYSTDPVGRAAASAFLFLAATIATVAVAAEPSPKARAEQVLARRTYQADLPDEPARARPIQFGSLDPNFTRLLGGIAIVAALVAAGALIFAFVRRFGDEHRSARTTQTPTMTPVTRRDLPDAEWRGPTLADADRLADAGDYRAAVHALLLVAIDESARRTARSFPSSTTARELTRLLPFDPIGHEGFGVLVRAVERSVFAGRNVHVDEYAACREQCLLLRDRPAV